MSIKDQLREACVDVNGKLQKSVGDIVCKVDGGEISTFGPTQRNPDTPQGVDIDFEGGRTFYTQPEKIIGYRSEPDKNGVSSQTIEISNGTHDKTQVHAGTVKGKKPPEDF